jgi:hypothetical protein
MGSRGIATAALLILVALTCIAIAKRLEGERRMIRKLRELRATDSRKPIPLDDLDDIERDAFDRLHAAGVIRMDRKRGYINPEALRTFKGKRMRFALTGGLLALLLAIAIAYIVLH